MEGWQLTTVQKMKIRFAISDKKSAAVGTMNNSGSKNNDAMAGENNDDIMGDFDNGLVFCFLSVWVFRNCVLFGFF